MDPKEQQELLERIQDTDEEEKYPLLFTFDFQEDMEEKGPALCLDFQRGAAFYTFQKGPALYLPFPRGSAIQTFQKGLYLAFVFAVARLQTFFFVPSSWLPSTHPIWT
ncbi:unnamed protein product [Boreogadus saida]